VLYNSHEDCDTKGLVDIEIQESSSPKGPWGPLGKAGCVFWTGAAHCQETPYGPEWDACGEGIGSTCFSAPLLLCSQGRSPRKGQG
jgi:hypothetical protein